MTVLIRQSATPGDNHAGDRVPEPSRGGRRPPEPLGVVEVAENAAPRPTATSPRDTGQAACPSVTVCVAAAADTHAVLVR